MYKGYLYLVFILFIWNCAKRNDETFAIKELVKIHQKISTSSLDSSSIYLEQAKRIIQSASDVPDSLKAENDYLSGLYFLKKGDLDSAVVYFHQATDYVRDSIRTKQQVRYFTKAFEVYLGQKRFGDCISISDRFISLLDRERDFKNLVLAFYFYENIYKQTPDPSKALENNLLRIEMLRLTKDTLSLAPALISQAYLKYYYLKDKEGTFKILEDLIEKEETLSKDTKRLLFGDYGIYLFYEGAFKKAKENYIKGLNFTPDLVGERDRLATAYSNLAEVCIELKEYSEAESYIDSVYALGLNNISERFQKSTLKYHLRLVHLRSGDLTEMFSRLDTIYKYQDERYKAKYNSDLVALSKANEKEKILLAEKQNADLKTLRLQLFSVLLILITLIGILFYRQRKYRFEKQNLQMQQRLLRSQMNPHFTFNILYAIQNLIKKNQTKAVDYLLKFSRLLRLILENSMLDYVQLEKELESLKKYLELQLLRFPSKFKYEIVLEDLNEDDLVFIPPMLLQPIVENSIEHGFSSIDYKGEIIIRLSRKDNFLSCVIEDNGIGLTDSTHQEKRSTSTILISDFLEKAAKTRIKMFDRKALSKDQTGVIVKFLIPYKHTEDG